MPPAALDRRGRRASAGAACRRRRRSPSASSLDPGDRGARPGGAPGRRTAGSPSASVATEVTVWSKVSRLTRVRVPPPASVTVAGRERQRAPVDDQRGRAGADAAACAGGGAAVRRQGGRRRQGQHRGPPTSHARGRPRRVCAIRSADARPRTPASPARVRCSYPVLAMIAAARRGAESNHGPHHIQSKEIAHAVAQHSRTAVAVACAVTLGAAPLLVHTAATAKTRRGRHPVHHHQGRQADDHRPRGQGPATPAASRSTSRARGAAEIVMFDRGYEDEDLEKDLKAADKGDIKALKRALANTTSSAASRPVAAAPSCCRGPASTPSSPSPHAASPTSEQVR